jgi:hypothetical protein
MRATKMNKQAKQQQRSNRRRQQARESLSVFGGALALPEEELRRLVFQITSRASVEPFVRQMIRLVDSLQAGRTKPLMRLAAHKHEPASARLLAALAEEAQSGSIVVARNTALWAAGCAYQNSLDYFFDLLSYLGHFRSKHDQQKRPLRRRLARQAAARG